MEFISSMIFGTIFVVIFVGLICAPVCGLWLIYVIKGKPSTRIITIGSSFCIIFSLLVFCVVCCRTFGKYFMDEEIGPAAAKGDTSTVECALWFGVDVNEQGENYGPTPLMAAAANGQNDTVKFLLLHHADVSFQGPGNNTALQSATEHGHADTAQILEAAGAKWATGMIPTCLGIVKGMSPLIQGVITPRYAASPDRPPDGLRKVTP